MAVLTLAGAGYALFAAGANPAMALCKYGGPNCVNPNPGPKYPTVKGEKIPDSGWVDPDCKYYGNCQSPNSARRVPGGKLVPREISVTVMRFCRAAARSPRGNIYCRLWAD